MTSEKQAQLLKPGGRGSMLRRERIDECLQSLKLESNIFSGSINDEILSLEKEGND